jgi:hypothetical protein
MFNRRAVDIFIIFSVLSGSEFIATTGTRWPEPTPAVGFDLGFTIPRRPFGFRCCPSASTPVTVRRFLAVISRAAPAASNHVARISFGLRSVAATAAGARYLTVAGRAEPAARRARPSGMNTAPRVRAFRGPLRTTALVCAALMSGAALLLAGCSGRSASSPMSASAPAHGAARSGAAAAPVPAGIPGPGSASSRASQAAQLTLASQSIIYTASLTIQAKDVTAAAARATGIVIAEGGYVSSEQAAINPRDPARSTVSLQLKIPVAQYAGTLSTLSTALGTQTSLTQRAQDVTQQVADVSSLVSSAQAAITQLQALLERAGSISALLTVQQQIAAQESSLEALQAQQRALDRETSYATVSVTLLSPHPVTAKKKKASKATRQHGFLAGFATGWRGLRLITSGLLTALGAALPFAVLGAVLAAAGYAGRRHLRRLRRWPRRGTRPTAAG